MVKRVPKSKKTLNNPQNVIPTQETPKPKKSPQLTITKKDLQIISPLTPSQSDFFDSYQRGYDFITLQGVAGSGKTLIALYKALEEVLDQESEVDRVIIVRSAVTARALGHLPGDLQEKLEVYEQPYQQLCQLLFNRSDAWSRLNEQKKVTFLSSSFLRGLTFDNAVIIVDECQSMTWHELNSIITRVGEQSKIIFVGDLKQNDLLTNKHEISGLPKFIKVARNLPDFQEIIFGIDDIVRSGLVKQWIIACEKID